MKKRGLIILCVGWVLVWVCGCATMGPSKPVPYKLSSQGTVIWDDEFEFLHALGFNVCDDVIDAP